MTVTARSVVAGKYDTGAVANGLHFNLKRNPRQREPTRKVMIVLTLYNPSQ